MKISQQEYEERAARVAAGNGSDDDRRLVELYAGEAGQQAGNGFSVSIRSEGEVVKPARKAAPRRGRANGDKDNR